MSRCQGLPYKAANPRSVRGAKKRGWYVVNADKTKLKADLSWLGLCIWAEKSSSGYWVSSFQLREFAFENDKDAMLFKLKWG